MTRKYELKRRAERQQETRRRIVEAAVQLHRTKGPGRTTFTDVARLAGVERHTLYRHFPDERRLFQACSGLFFETNPPPDPTVWRAIAEPDMRLRQGLGDLYGWYEQVEDMLSCVLRDADTHLLTGETFRQQAGPLMAEVRDSLLEVLPSTNPAQALLDLAIDFRGWQRLHASGLTNAEAAEAMTRAVGCT
jgi:AcrR family transcriptional regulator